jgi:hypothetical protein
MKYDPMTAISQNKNIFFATSVVSIGVNLTKILWAAFSYDI